jgi:hypothetical protein
MAGSYYPSQESFQESFGQGEISRRQRRNGNSVSMTIEAMPKVSLLPHNRTAARDDRVGLLESGIYRGEMWSGYTSRNPAKGYQEIRSSFWLVERCSEVHR